MTQPSTRDELRDWDRRHYWHAFTQMTEYEPLVIARAEGCRLVDIDGREYQDGASSMWCNVHGHNHPRINAAIRDQLERVAHCTSLGMGCDTTVRLARRLADLAPGNLEHVFFSSDGSSAVEVALKAAFQYWRQCREPRPAKTRYVALGEAYHGDTIGAASVGGIARFQGMFGPLLFDVIRAPVPDPRTMSGMPSSAEADVGMMRSNESMPTPLRDEGMPPNTTGTLPTVAAKFFLEQVESLLEAHHEEVAALVIEPLVQFAAGMVMHPPGYLRGVRELTRRYDVLLIADEIATGFGRTGTMFACEQEEVVPDFLCLGKGLTGGYLPMSATLTHDEIHTAFLGEFHEGRTLYHGHTYGGNPLAAAAALASLDLFDEEQTLVNLRPKIALLGEHLCALAEHPHVATTRQRGFVGALELTPNKATGEPYPAEERRGWQVCREALRRGVWIRPLGDVLYVAPPLAMAMDELDYLMNALVAAIDTVTN